MSPPTPREFKILSIDGGGIKGTYSAFLLAALEHQLDRGKKLGSYFDMVAGTSTGSLIALGLAAGRSAKEIAEAYESDGGLIFCDHHPLHRAWRGIRQALIKAKYEPTQLGLTLDRLLGEKTLSEAANYVCVPVTVINNYAPRVYKTRHSEKHSWKNVTLKHLALASSAAPTFFPLVESEAIQGTLYADGGLFANNPALVALIEAFRVFVGPDSERKSFDSVSIMSIGSFPSPATFKVSRWRTLELLPTRLRNHLSTAWRSRPARGWMWPAGGAPPLVDILMQVQGKYIEYMLPILQNAFASRFSSYVRLDATTCKSGHGGAVNDLTAFSMADGRPKKIAEMKRLGETAGMASASDPQVRHFFDQVITPITLHPHPTT
ncbi:MAG: patatin-like phospholipase family protein [Methylacidiphilales bacterium]|nr:patatin-like phospholipase family protein [Candidatus Methylacidiphilales bacterium]